jgi:hypothetical protein
MLQVQVRYSNDLSDNFISINPGMTAGQLAEVLYSNEHLRDTRIRLIYRGRILPAHHVLAEVIHFEDGRAIISCAVGPAVKTTEPQIGLSSETAAVGFDRLLELGFNDHEILEFRRQFHTLRSQDDTSQLEAEEQWFNPEDDRPEFSVGSLCENLIGITLGFFLGFLALVWIKDKYLVTTRMQQGILVGIFLNIVFGFFRYFK